MKPVFFVDSGHVMAFPHALPGPTSSCTLGTRFAITTAASATSTSAFLALIVGASQKPDGDSEEEYTDPHG